MNTESKSSRMMAMLVVAMALLCMVRAGDSFQQDEIGLIAMIKAPFSEMVYDYSNIIPMLSPYEILAWCVGKYLGYSEAWLRLPSMMFGAIMLHFLWRSSSFFLPPATAWMPSLVVLAMPPVQHAICEARPYAMAFALVSVAIFHGARFLTDSASWRAWYLSCFFWAFAGWTRINVFEAFLPFALFSGLILHRRGLFSFTRFVGGCLFVAGPALLMLPMAFRFGSTSHIHGYTGGVSTVYLLEWLIFSWFPPAVMALVLGSFLVKCLAHDEVPIQKKSMAAAWLLVACAIFPAVLHWLVWVWKGTFVISARFLGATFPAAALAFGIFIGIAATSRIWRSLFISGLVVAILVSLSDNTDREDWRRGVALVNASSKSSDQLVLVLNGAFQSAHVDMIRHRFFLGPDAAYGIKGTSVAIPSVVTPESVDYMQSVLAQHRALVDSRPVLIIAKSKFRQVPKWIAKKLSRKTAAVSLGGVDVYEIF